MAFLVLILSGLPCADRNEKSENCKQEISAANHHDSDAPDDCSPFCHCTCCCGFSLNHNFSTLPSITPFVDSRLNNYLSLQTIEVSLPIWQPPQLI
jgi:uncharacterized protein DUF6660